MSGQHWHKRYHGNALTGFMALTLEERGAYQTLLDMIYDRGGPLIDNERLLAGYMGVSIRKWRSLRATLIEKGKVRINRHGLITNSRAEKEIENASKTHRKLIEAGSKGGRVRAENEKNTNEINETDQAVLKAGSSDPQAILEARSKSSVTNVTGGEPPDIPKMIFDLGIKILTDAGTKPNHARSLLGKWRRDFGDSGVLIALTDCQTKSISNPVEWMPRRLAARPASFLDSYTARVA